MFDTLWEALMPLNPATRWEHDQQLSEFISQSWDLPPGMLLCTMLIALALRQYIQVLDHLDAELDFMVAF